MPQQKLPAAQQKPPLIQQIPLKNAKHEAFARAIVEGCSGREAYGAAGYKAKPAAADANASRLLKDAKVAARVAELKTAASAASVAGAAQVLDALWAIASTDANELVEHRIGCCRYCWGIDFRYQYTKAEFDRVDSAHEQDRSARIEAGKRDIGDCDPGGGTGFNRTRQPNAKCPECCGEGLGRPVFKDSTKASAAARALYGGVKVTRDGMEMKLHDKADALEKLARHFGLLKDRIEHSGPNGGPIQTKPDVSSRDLAKALLAALSRD
jgi:phage terminase small subunit